eukprot:4974640-Amphidinium_carterae.1
MNSCMGLGKAAKDRGREVQASAASHGVRLHFQYVIIQSVDQDAVGCIHRSRIAAFKVWQGHIEAGRKRTDAAMVLQELLNLPSDTIDANSLKEKVQSLSLPPQGQKTAGGIGRQGNSTL